MPKIPVLVRLCSRCRSPRACERHREPSLSILPPPPAPVRSALLRTTSSHRRTDRLLCIVTARFFWGKKRGNNTRQLTSRGPRASSVSKDHWLLDPGRPSQRRTANEGRTMQACTLHFYLGLKAWSCFLHRPLPALGRCSLVQGTSAHAWHGAD